MRVYIVMEDNGESYEDYVEYIVSVHSTKEKAINAIKARGFKERTEQCGRKGSFDKKVEDYDGWPTTVSAWIIEQEVDA